MLLVIFIVLFIGVAASSSASSQGGRGAVALDQVEVLVREWAPLVWLAPGEKFFPNAVPEFLHHVTAKTRGRGHSALAHTMPLGRSSEQFYLVTNNKLERLLKNYSSFIYGRNPYRDPVPVYALVNVCSNATSVDDNEVDSFASPGSQPQPQPQSQGPSFHVTYWMFYPFSEGKSMCTVDVGMLGVWPIPVVAGYCLGSYREFGNHVGDWEHMSLLFKGKTTPESMYVSAHDAGAFYSFQPASRTFKFQRQEVRSGVLQRPTFPPTVHLTYQGYHPVLFAAKGSHGLWTAPGKHKFVRLPRLYDDSGYGIPWATWKYVELIPSIDWKGLGSSPTWVKFRGRWGNPKNKCHPLSRLGINICQFTDGPVGISMKKDNFKCSELL